MKKHGWFIVPIVAAVICLIVYIVRLHGTSDFSPYATLATVNGEPIAAGELQLAFDQVKTEVIDNLGKKFGVQDRPDFWNSMINNETPIQIAKQKALRLAINLKIPFLLAKKHGLIQAADYKTFMTNLQIVNGQRRDAHEKGQILYGPIQFNERDYAHYIQSNLVSDLKRQLISGLDISEEKLRERYESMKDANFREVPIIRGSLWSVHAGATSLKEQEDYFNKLRSIKQQDAGSIPDVSIESIEMNALTVKRDSMNWPSLVAQARSAFSGEWVGPLQDRTGFYLLKVENRIEGAYVPFETAKQVIFQQLAKEALAKEVNEATDRAEVVVKQEFGEWTPQM
ncbi:peptidylprolyl isomerase [Paenibacillus roseipurpureus]|uniref:Uncharacterized protein n=1 Tax=Paenibacillus roseopurpureus TaxID=2918901 RepID=A0AA96RNW4_9BACL|nr:hypothetical protein [Paenibacillus sp. MBLB1832]WNR45967.1 hypothetical protein MJB10_07685 [Paenibacillus sp. MBLB1832]